MAARTGTWMPLCRGYFSLHFNIQWFQLCAANGASREQAVLWGLGALSDGDREVLGAWQAADAGPALWRSVLEEVAARGVERISFVFADLVADMDAIYPGAKVLPPFMRIHCHEHVSLASGVGLLRAEARHAVREASSVRAAQAVLERLMARSEVGRAALLASDWPKVLALLEPFYALRSKSRALASRGDEALEHLGRTLSRAVGRHGPFANGDAATSFVSTTLARAESQLSSFVRPEARLATRRSGVLAVRATVAASGR